MASEFLRLFPIVHGGWTLRVRGLLLSVADSIVPIPHSMRKVLPAPPRRLVIASKLMGATMWCWILWRFKHDWKDVFVSLPVITQL